LGTDGDRTLGPRVLSCGHCGLGLRPPWSCSAAPPVLFCGDPRGGFNDRVDAGEVLTAGALAATLDLQHTGCLKRTVATVKRVDAEPGAVGQLGAHDLGRKPAAVAALLCAELEQADHGPEVTQRVTVVTSFSEPFGRHDGDRRPRRLLDSEMQQRCDHSAATVCGAPDPDHAGADKDVKQRLDGRSADSGSVTQGVVAGLDALVVADVALLVRQPAEQPVEPDRS
jgi:hypothetical protein